MWEAHNPDESFSFLLPNEVTNDSYLWVAQANPPAGHSAGKGSSVKTQHVRENSASVTVLAQEPHFSPPTDFEINTATDDTAAYVQKKVCRLFNGRLCC